MRAMYHRIWTDLKEYRLAILALFVYGMVVRGVFHAFCPMVILTGLPCPGCGLSRAVWCLLTLQPARAFALHPLSGFWLLLIFYGGVRRYCMGKQMQKGYWRCALLLCLATVLLYLYRMAVLFPGNPPISYTGRNLAERLLPDYRQRILSFFRLYRRG